uniref:Uncharacterized protein n=1 Tax=Arundo donax TaxID=35708 RepID=A0A0A9AC37_ARUDO
MWLIFFNLLRIHIHAIMMAVLG